MKKALLTILAGFGVFSGYKSSLPLNENQSRSNDISLVPDIKNEVDDLNIEIYKIAPFLEARVDWQDSQ
jgi:hypothetical protein